MDKYLEDTEIDKKNAAYEKYASEIQGSNMFLTDIVFGRRG